MEPLEYYYEPINRNAFIVKPKAPFFNWRNEIFSDEEPMNELEENNIYLIREMPSNEDIMNWIRKNYKNILVNELNDWCADKNL